MPKPGDKRYKGPVHEAVRKSPIGGLVKKKRKTAPKKRVQAREATKKNRAQYKKDEAEAYKKGYRKTSQGKWTKPKNVKAYDNAKKASANAARMGPDTMREKRATIKKAKPTRSRSTVKKTVTRRTAVPKKTGSTSRTRSTTRVAAKVAARSGLSKSAARAKARKIIKKRGR